MRDGTLRRGPIQEEDSCLRHLLSWPRPEGTAGQEASTASLHCSLMVSSYAQSSGMLRIRARMRSSQPSDALVGSACTHGRPFLPASALEQHAPHREIAGVLPGVGTAPPVSQPAAPSEPARPGRHAAPPDRPACCHWQACAIRVSSPRATLPFGLEMAARQTEPCRWKHTRTGSRAYCSLSSSWHSLPSDCAYSCGPTAASSLAKRAADPFSTWPLSCMAAQGAVVQSTQGHQRACRHS